MDTDPVAIAPCYSIFVGMNNTVLQNTVATEGNKGGFLSKITVVMNSAFTVVTTWYCLNNIVPDSFPLVTGKMMLFCVL
jgi:hypothetical protein